MEENPTIEKGEWCFQFNDDTPVVMGSFTDSRKLILELTPLENVDSLVFKDTKNKNQFKIFARKN